MAILRLKYNFWPDKQSHNNPVMYVFMGEVVGETNEIRIAEISWTDEGTNGGIKKKIHAFCISFTRVHSKLNRPLARSCLVRVRGILGGDFRHKRGFGRKVDRVRFCGNRSEDIMVTTK